MRFTKKILNNSFNKIFLKYGVAYTLQTYKLQTANHYLITTNDNESVVAAGFTLEDVFLSLMSYLSYYNNRDYYTKGEFMKFAIDNNLI